MATQVFISITTSHPRERFPTPESVADHFGIPREAIDAHTTRVNGVESDLIFVCWREGTIFPDGVKVSIHLNR